MIRHHLLYISVVLLFLAQATIAAISSWSQFNFSPTRKHSPFTVTPCGSQKHHALFVEQVTVTPDRPVPGEEIAFNILGQIKKQPEGTISGAVIFKSKPSGERFTGHFDICEELKKSEDAVQCPFEIGSFNLTHTITLPSDLPKEKIQGTLHAAYYSDSGPHVFTCLKINSNFRPESQRSTMYNRFIGY